MSEHEARPWRLAGATTICLRLARPLFEHGHGCNLCHGTGQVPLLGAAVRVTCSACLGTTIRNAALVPGRFDGRDCLSCHGLGYKPSTDPMVWMRELAKAGYYSVIGCHQHGGFWAGIQKQPYVNADTPLGALLEAAEQALIAAGLMEAVPVREETP